MRRGQLQALEYAVERFEHYIEQGKDKRVLKFDRAKVDAARDALAAAWGEYERTRQGDMFGPGLASSDAKG